jgi:CDP-glucose 4,6-dehydratase
MNRSFWKGKKVLITGHTGFKGSWLSLWLQNLEATVLGYALAPPTEPSLFELADVSTGMISIEGDIRNFEQLNSVVAEYEPDIVFHLAAQPLVRHSYELPVETYATNVLGTVHLLEAVRRSKGGRVVVSITSDKCYQNKEWFWGYREEDRLGGHDPYSSSKACAELVIAAYRASYFLAQADKPHNTVLASARAGNVIGGGDWAKDRLIPDIIRAMMEHQPVIIRHPNATRPWQHVLQPLSGYLCLAEHLWLGGTKYAQAWNFGPRDEDAKPVAWIADYLTRLWGGEARWELDVNQNPHEDTYLKLDFSKAEHLLKWKPKLNLATTLEWIAEWYLAYHRGENMRQRTETQIRRFEDHTPP